LELFSLLAKLTLDADEFDRELDSAQSKASDFEMPDTPELELDTDGFESGVTEAEELGTGFGSTMENVFGQVKTALIGAGIVGLIGNIVSELKEAINMTAQTADGIDKGAKKLGISRKSYQEWDHALRQSGASIADVKKGIINMQAAIKAADPATPFADAKDAADGLADKTAGLSEDAKEAFREIGLIGDLTKGKFKDADELMSATLIRLAELTESGEISTDERGILVRKLFGRGGDSLNALLDEGATGVKALLDEADQLGLIMSDEEINNAVKYGDTIANLNAELDAIKQAFVQDIIPVLTEAAKWLTDFLSMFNPRLRENSLTEAFDIIDERTEKASSKFDIASVNAQALIDKLADMGNYWLLDDQGKKTWNALAQEFIDQYPDFRDYINLEKKCIEGNTDAIKENIRQWTERQKQQLLSEAFEEKSKLIAEQYVKAMDKEAEANVKAQRAEDQRRESIIELNKELESAGMKQLPLDASLEDYSDAMVKLIESLPEDDPAQLRIGLIGKKWGEEATEAARLRKEAEDLRKEADEAKESYEKQQEELLKMMANTSEETEKTISLIQKLNEVISELPSTVALDFAYGAMPKEHAIGADYIPWDNYPALLHRGEKVLTATEARQQGTADFTGMEDRIVAAIREGMSDARVTAVVTDKQVASGANRYNGNELDAGRFLP